MDPLDYAAQSKNSGTIGAIYQGINSLDEDARLKIMANMHIETLLDNFTSDLVTLIADAGIIVPKT